MPEHKLENYKIKTRIAVGVAATAGAGLVLPLAFAGPANAASLDSWERIAACESGDMNKPGSARWNINYGDGGLSKGGLQFQRASWNDALAYLRKQGINTSSYPSWDNLGSATKKQQIIAGEALLALQGPGAWACNLPGHGIASGALSNQKSMFKGGINPYPESTTPSTPTTPTTPTNPSASTHKVVKGDTLYSIAAKYKIAKWQDLYSWNKSVIGSNPNVIEIGQVLNLKAPSTSTKYTVKAGDTLSKIAETHKVPGEGVDGPWKTLYNANKTVIGSNPDLIFPGQVLTVPTSVVATSPTSGEKPKTPTPAPTASWVKPVALSTGYAYGVRNSGYAAGFHTGVDFPGAVGTPVKAVGAGTVVTAQAGSTGYGNHVVIKHADGKFTLYAHLSRVDVTVGTSVSAGKQIGLLGSSGNSTGPHLHFEVRTSNAYGAVVDPVAYLRAKGVSL
jgi:murein DD-endopeptidase MepM/ murein hydrolase activator NlpD